MVVAALEPGVVIAIVVVVVTLASALVFAGVSGALGRWREEINKPRGSRRDDSYDGDGRP